MTAATSHVTEARRKEIASLTSLRGILALWVVLYHFGNDIIGLFPATTFLGPLFYKGNLAVPGFFMLSGFVLSYNYANTFTSPSTFTLRNLFRFWLLRFARIYPVHFVTLLAVAVMVAIARSRQIEITDSGYSAHDFILNLFLIQTWVPHFVLNWNYPSWSISSEWFVYLTFPAACRLLLVRTNTFLQAAGFAAICLAASCAAYHVESYPFKDLIVAVPTFFAGTAIYSLGKTKQLARHLPHNCTRLLIGAFLTSCFVFVNYAEAVLISITFLLILSLAASKLRSEESRPWSPVYFLGEVSYSLYMTHAVAQKILNELLPAESYYHDAVTIRIGVAAVYTLLITALCLGSYYFIETPCRNHIRRLTTPSIVRVPSPVSS